VISPDDVTACLVTRGDQVEQIDRILESLIFDRCIIWDNSVNRDWKCAGRYLAAMQAHTDIVYFQDDDVLVPAETQLALLDAYEEGVCVANWGHGDNPDGYHDLPLVGAGAVVDRGLCFDSIVQYAARWPLDETFQFEADFVVGVLYPDFRHLHLPFEINYGIAQHPSRLVNQPWQRDLKYEITQRARGIRDERLVAA
jgi:hypothetical protein